MLQERSHRDVKKTIVTLPEQPIDVLTFDCKFPYTNSKKCMNCDKNINRILAMMNGNYMDIISIFKAAGKMLKDGTDRFQDTHKLGIVKALIKFGQRSEVLVNTHALMLDDIIWT
ncbi:uncharacterized protein FFB20_05273 [Fusarium fujikuroi]|uniref:Uncharacterized protein n=1 Tax=Fusarium fujikuroi TaxID=5127 RepID=A0A2H3S2D7_FUSFU|nr:Uncharacterized protein LW94_3395 [Fusarium fujikuroi]KLP11526.1 Uncharacterized protein Y057_10090 [Fusarium fujikuroi]QGI66242.1 hypothetical protein CEK27_010213 [Fusarium fujikuroi]QGI83484.1 hypothetical protein CEK25_010213 [Fusarium fujikuroi]QGI97126.1 hypothetical protein CEK26_010195 [Fusarium fujikuroi]